MGTINWAITEQRYTDRLADINANVTQNDWLGFLDALGWMENSGKYNDIAINNSEKFAGMYQVNEKQLEYERFVEVRKGLFGFTSLEDFAGNPLAQDLAAIIEFSGNPHLLKTPGKSFVSKYTAVKDVAQELFITHKYYSHKLEKLR